MSRYPDPCERVFLSIELSELLNSLPRDHKFWNWIDELGDLLLSNRDVGIKIPRKKFPKKYIGKYGIITYSNLIILRAIVLVTL
jgi:hypothetical protein